MQVFIFLFSFLPAIAFCLEKETQPNIVLIYADDVGYGDIACQRKEASLPTPLPTPHIDRLATEGLRLKSAYAGASTCTPSRYTLLTGEYSFRKKGTGVLQGDARMIIEPTRQTLGSLLTQAGYFTGIIGKWHLGLGQKKTINWNKPITCGPRELGFSYSFILPATNDRVPFIFLENQQVVNANPKDPIMVSYTQPIGNDPTGRTHPELLRMLYSQGHDGTIINGISRIGFMSGGYKARIKDEDIPQTLLDKSRSFIQKAQKKHQPFFLLLSTIDIHVPRVPHKQFANQSSLGARGDAILQLDWTVGEIYKILEKQGILNDTLIIFTSDNGPFLDDGYDDKADFFAQKYHYHPSSPYSGYKYSTREGGARIPFIVRYPKKIKPMSISSALFSQADILASLAALTGQKLNTKSAPDSQNLLPVLFGEQQGRKQLFFEACNGPVLICNGWKYWHSKRNGYQCPKGKALYHLTDDPLEQNNLIENPAYKDIEQGMRTFYHKALSTQRNPSVFKK